MASSSSDESSKAPENFQVSSASNDEDDDCGGKQNTGSPHDVILKRKSRNGLRSSSYATKRSLRCHLCHKQQTKFSCRNCIKNGNISLGPHGPSLNEMQQKYIALKADIRTFGNDYERLINDQKILENINFAIKAKKERLGLIKLLIVSKKNRLASLNNFRDNLHKANAEKRKTLPNYPLQVKKLEDYVLDRIEKISRLREKQKTILEILKEKTRHSIQELVECIFPIKEIVLKEEREKNLEAAKGEDLETRKALAEAKNTSYIRGKWVLHGSGISEMQYQIVAPSLPANGDYSSYLSWLIENKDEESKSATSDVAPSKITAFRILGALTYTAQLIKLMSFYLNIRLPFDFPYGDFCKKLNEDQFQKRVSQLNSNIMYLAYTQNVILRNLNEDHTLENVLILLDVNRSDLGRFGSCNLAYAPLKESVDSLLIGLETGTESESEDENSFRYDWEAVTNIPDHQEINAETFISPNNQQTSIADGLITAANKFTSVLRLFRN